MTDPLSFLGQLRWPSLSSVVNGVTRGASDDAQTAGNALAALGSTLANTGQQTGDLASRLRSGEIDPIAFGKAAAGRAYGTVADAVTAPQRAYSGDLPIYDPTTGHTTQEAREAASGLAGLAMTGGLGGVAMRQGETALGAGPIRAYHGSPHDFDRFDISKIGTGEGAQVYGHGLYFAENEATAKAYRDALGTPARIAYADGPIPKHGGMKFEGNPVRAAADALMAGQGNIGKAQTYAQKNFGPQIDDVMAELGSGKLSYVPKQGRMYEVAIDADPARMLDWDAPLSAQSKQVREFTSDRMSDANTRGLVDIQTGRRPYEPFDPTGMDFYEGAGGRGSMWRAALADDMREAGIPGIRYLDRGSRVGGDGTRNYVTFSDDIVSLIRKYGLAAVAGGGGALAALGRPDDAQAAPLARLGQR